MNPREQITNIFVTIIANILNKTEDEMLAKLDAKFKEDFEMTSLQYFPLISELEDKLDIEVDYSDFLTRALTVNDGVDFILAIVKN